MKTSTTSAEATPRTGRRESDAEQRLLDGLAESIQERGYRETTIADIVRHARTSRRTFYAEFDTKDDCFVALVRKKTDQMRQNISTAVDADAPWETQVEQAITAYVDEVSARPEITLSWIRELPALGIAREVQRGVTESLVDMVFQLSDTEHMREVGFGPVSRPIAVMLLGGLRELTAMTVEDGGDIREVAVTATKAAIALLAPGKS